MPEKAATETENSAADLSIVRDAIFATNVARQAAAKLKSIGADSMLRC